MECSSANSDQYALISSSSSSSSSSSFCEGINNSSDNRINSNRSACTFTSYGISFPFRSAISLVFDYSNMLRSTSARGDSEPVAVDNSGVATAVATSEPRHRLQLQSPASASASAGNSGSGSGTGKVEICIIGAAEQENNVGSGSVSSSSTPPQIVSLEDCDDSTSGGRVWPQLDPNDPEIQRRLANEGVVPVADPFDIISDAALRHDAQEFSKWFEQILPFCLLFVVVLIRQHLQGFFVAICISAVVFKSNEIVKEQTALKRDREASVLIGIAFAFMLIVVWTYWWYRNDDLFWVLVMFPPKATPFWNAIFIIFVNDTLVRQASMALKCLLLIYYKNGRGNFHRQGQMLTLVEYTLLFYRALLPTPVWYQFFLNKDYGSLFSLLMTGLYLTLKLISVVGKVRSFVSALKALSKREVDYGVYATVEQVNAAGDLCAICHEKMHTPILLRCKHMFCEDCVSEWFERERTCPLCRAVIKSTTGLHTFGDGSTGIFFQLF